MLCLCPLQNLTHPENNEIWLTWQKEHFWSFLVSSQNQLSYIFSWMCISNTHSSSKFIYWFLSHIPSKSSSFPRLHCGKKHYGFQQLRVSTGNKRDQSYPYERTLGFLWKDLQHVSQPSKSYFIQCTLNIKTIHVHSRKLGKIDKVYKKEK